MLSPLSFKGPVSPRGAPSLEGTVSLEGRLSPGLSPGVGSKVIQPKPSKAISAHWWAWSQWTVCSALALMGPTRHDSGGDAGRSREHHEGSAEVAVTALPVVEEKPVHRVLPGWRPRGL